MNTEIEKRKNEIKEKVNNLFEIFKEAVQITLAVCPEWKVSSANVNVDGAEISISLKECSDFYMKILYNKGDELVKESFDVRVTGGCTFNPLDDDSNTANYYCSVADIIQHKRMLKTLKEYMISSINVYRAFFKEYTSLES